jgi:hypothetical protein
VRVSAISGAADIGGGTGFLVRRSLGEIYPRLAYAYCNRGMCYELIGLDDLEIAAEMARAGVK